jgi:hypothetical protein
LLQITKVEDVDELYSIAGRNSDRSVVLGVAVGAADRRSILLVLKRQ